MTDVYVRAALEAADVLVSSGSDELANKMDLRGVQAFLTQLAEVQSSEPPESHERHAILMLSDINKSDEDLAPDQTRTNPFDSLFRVEAWLNNWPSFSRDTDAFTINTLACAANTRSALREMGLLVARPRMLSTPQEIGDEPYFATKLHLKSEFSGAFPETLRAAILKWGARATSRPHTVIIECLRVGVWTTDGTLQRSMSLAHMPWSVIDPNFGKDGN